MIREFQLSTTGGDDEQQIYEPPVGILHVCVIGEEAPLDWREQLRPDQPSADQVRACSFRVSARSLLLALRAAWDDEHPGTSELDRGDRPINAGQPWTGEQDAQLRDTWLASRPPAAARISELAKAMGRSPGGIDSRLPRVGCDPSMPGRLLKNLHRAKLVHRRRAGRRVGAVLTRAAAAESDIADDTRITSAVPSWLRFGEVAGIAVLKQLFERGMAQVPAGCPGAILDQAYQFRAHPARP